MAMECKGLPIALIVVGSSMAGVNSMEAWRSSRENLLESSWTASDLETKVFSILKFSYDRLPDEVHKKCFLYCALYPEDYEILVRHLIDRLIGEGFLSKDMSRSIQDLRGDCESIILKLKLSCLLESVYDMFVKMHDVLRDMALWLACDQDKRIKKVLVQGDARAASLEDDVEKWKIVERISVVGGKEWHVPSATFPNLVTLLVQECGRIKGLENIRYMSRLKCLELQVDGELNLPEEIGDLVLLEYLCLYGEAEESSLMELKKLRNLKFLLCGGKTSFPLGVISCLKELRVLSFKLSTRELVKEVECLPKIEELGIIITTTSGFNILCESAKLQKCTYYLCLEEMELKMDLLLAYMSNMKHLQWFELSNCGVEDSLALEPCCFTMLRYVTIVECQLITHLTWLKYAPLLQFLQIYFCDSVEEVIEEESTEVENVDSSTFSSLVHLSLRGLPELKSIHKIPSSFPSLEAIKIFGCPNLKRLPLASNSAKLKLTRIEGEQDWWDNLEWDDSATKLHFQSKFQPSKH